MHRTILPLIVALLAPSVTTGCGDASASSGEATFIPRVGVPVIRKPSEITLPADLVKLAGIRTAEFTDRAVETSIRVTGRIAWDDLRVAHVYSPVTGRVASIAAGLGDRVKRGAALASVISPDIGQWSSDMGKAKADLVAAEHDFKRKRELLDLKAVARSDYEASQDNYRQAKAEMDRAQQKIALLRSGGADFVSQSFSLTTPIEGEIVALMVNPGLEIQGQYDNGNTTELFTVGERDSMRLMSDVYEADLGRVKLGARVTATVVGFPDKVFEGKVDWISGGLDASTRTAQVRCTLANPENVLKPDMSATARIVVPEKVALAVPRSAVVRYGEQQVVFADVGPGEGGGRRYARLPVFADERVEGDWVPVAHGLDRGTTVVSAGAATLQERL